MAGKTLSDLTLKKIFALIKNGFYAKSESQEVAAISIDTTPTSGSTNLVTSGGVAAAIEEGKPKLQTITIAVADWAGGTTVTKSVTGITATSIVIVDTSDESVKCTGQGAGTLTFTAASTPTSAVTVKAVIFGNNNPSYTNLADPTSPEWLTNKRYNSSHVLTDADGYIISNLIQNAKTTSPRYLYVKGVNLQLSGSGIAPYARIYVFNSTKEILGQCYTSATEVEVLDADNRYYRFDLSQISSTHAYIAVGGKPFATVNDIVVTIDEEIR